MRHFHELPFIRRRQLTLGIVRLTFGGADLKSLAFTGIGDEYLRLFFPAPETGAVVLPTIDDTCKWH